MARPKKIPEAPQDVVTAEMEGAQATTITSEAGASEREQGPPSPKTPDPDAGDPPKGSGLFVVVVALQPSRWRIGRHFTSEPVHIPLDDLTEPEKAALIADPMLLVTAIEDI